MQWLLRPFRSAHRSLKRIKYYSAKGTRSGWQSAADWWLILSFPIAVGATFAVDDLVESFSAEPQIRIRLGQDSSSAPIRGWVEHEINETWPIGVPLGTATLFTTRETKGWPLATTEIEGPWTVKFTDFQGNCTIFEAPLPMESQETTDAIALVLDKERMAVVANQWIDGTTKTKQFTLTFIAQGAIYWGALFVLGVIGLQVLRLIAASIRHQRRRLIIRRLGRGICPECRYDLSGTKFPDYCPECGQRIWG